MPPVRRLTAILAADVAGYSRLMGADEEGTHERLRSHLRDLIEPKIAEHRGRIVKNTGDGFLAEFASVVDAVRCAVEMQRGMAERGAGIPPEQRIEFRIGVNLGDVIAEGEDIFGDGVNVETERSSVPAAGANLPGGRLRRGGIDIGAHHRCAFTPETESTRPADPATRTSDKRDLPLDPRHANSPRCSCRALYPAIHLGQQSTKSHATLEVSLYETASRQPHQAPGQNVAWEAIGLIGLYFRGTLFEKAAAQKSDWGNKWQPYP
jgi:hypothetical protein